MDSRKGNEEVSTKPVKIKGGIYLIPITMRDHFFYDLFFERWWPTYKNIHEKLIRDSFHFWSKVKESMEYGRSILPHFTTLGKPHNPASMIFPRQWMFPRFLSKEDFNELFGLDFFHLKQGNAHIFYAMNDDNQLEVDIHDYDPNEIEVKIKGNVLTVEAKHQEDMYLSQFIITHSLPKGCKAEMLRASMSSDGILVVRALKGKVAASFTVKVK